LAQLKGKLVLQLGVEPPEIPVALDAAKVLLGGQEGRGRPTKYHLAVLPAPPPIGPQANAGRGAFNDIGGAQATTRSRRQFPAINGDRLFQAFSQAGRRPRVMGLQPLHLFLEPGPALLPGQALGRLHHRLYPRLFGNLGHRSQKLVFGTPLPGENPTKLLFLTPNLHLDCTVA